MADLINHPPHYTSHPSGVECIQITEHMSFNLGNAVEYLWRADEKGDALADLQKARWYVDREIARRELGAANAAETAPSTPVEASAPEPAAAEGKTFESGSGLHTSMAPEYWRRFGFRARGSS